MSRGRGRVCCCVRLGRGWGWGLWECECDVGGPGEREREDRLGDGQRLSEHAWEAPREAVVVREVEGRRARQRERVGRDELRAGDGAHPFGAVRRLPRQGELLDRAVVPRVVHDEEVGVGPIGLGRIYVEPQGMKVVPLGIAFQRDPPRPSAEFPNVIEPERSAGRRVVQWTHDGVPGFAVGVAAEQQDLVVCGAAAVDLLPENGILAESHVIGRRVL